MSQYYTASIVDNITEEQFSFSSELKCTCCRRESATWLTMELLGSRTEDC